MIKIYSRMFVRSFFIQTVWNYERMQNMGFVFILKPFLDKVYLNENKKKEALLRHIGHFNTHPYMSGVVVAIVANLEKKIAEDNVTDAKLPDVNNIKDTMAGPLAALGDLFFFGTLRPAISFISIFMLIFFVKVLDDRFVGYGILIPFIFIVLYNVVHIAARYWIMFLGFKFGKESIFVLSSFKFLLTLTRYSGLIIAIAALVLYFSTFGFGLNGMFPDSNAQDAIVYGIVLVCSVLVASRFGGIFLFYTIILACMLMSYLGI
ncbi:MAG: PTS system mannose/fructose/sorbose family transporter subunit IID [Endomicrobium sp.]|uniref:PTS system mannose/fructose/sorbose family transporter subunit IID n=1 Tax=Candidatus Endomicrobiellum pyrsonymphae TaxID=1408203 RepID=UPI0035875BD0|nr:PTS system mannose/fructose/sorbose family transporter subunit IID [Endomicrobium sp.]